MDISKVLIPEEEIQAMVKRVASEINRDYEGKEVVVIDFMHVSSYQGTESTGFLKIKKDISTDIEGKHVIIVEDIIDTGNTLKALREMLAERGPASIKICTAFDKPSRRVNDLTPDYNGITVPDEFIIGYGLDYDGAYRNIKDIRIVR